MAARVPRCREPFPLSSPADSSLPRTTTAQVERVRDYRMPPPSPPTFAWPLLRRSMLLHGIYTPKCWAYHVTSCCRVGFMLLRCYRSSYFLPSLPLSYNVPEGRDSSLSSWLIKLRHAAKAQVGRKSLLQPCEPFLHHILATTSHEG